MLSVSSVIQGPEHLLFWRIYYQLQQANCSKLFLDSFQSHANDSTDDLIDLAYQYLPEINYYV